MSQSLAKLPLASDHPPPGLLRNRNFILLWCAYGISAVGDHLSELALLKTQNALSRDVDITPLNARITFLFFVPFFVFGPVAGMLADKFPRRLLMISADVVRAGIMASFVALIALTQGWGSWGPFLPLLLTGTFAAMFSPARSALLPTLVREEQLARANGMISGLGIIATMFAALIGGYLADHYDPRVAFQLDAASFVASAVCVSLMASRPGAARARVRAKRSSPLTELAGGFRYARCHRHVRELLVVGALVWFGGALVNSVIPAVVRDHWHGVYSGISACRACLGLGFVIGAIIVSLLGNALRADVAITWGLIGVGCAIALFAGSVYAPFEPDTLATIGHVAITLAGVFAMGVMASFVAMLQRTVADRFRGRVFGVNDLFSTGAMLLATGVLTLPTGVRVDPYVGPILIVVAISTFVAGVATMVIRYRRGPFGPKALFIWHLNELVSKSWWRLQRIGPLTVPRTGPCIVVANHRSTPDPALISACVPFRFLSFFIAAEYATWPVFRTFVKLLQCIPVRRGTRETAATRRALEALQEGRAMAAFIEGGILRPGQAPRLKDGVALLALRTGAPVIPAHVSGVRYTNGVLSGLFARHRARVRFGRPVDLSEFRDLEGRETVRAATAKIYAAIMALAPMDQPIGQPNDQPRDQRTDQPTDGSRLKNPVGPTFQSVSSSVSADE